jgi:hypothetical protein
VTAPNVTDHAWLRFSESVRPHAVEPGACAFMNCRRPRAEHVRVSERGDLVQDGIAAAKEARS